MIGRLQVRRGHVTTYGRRLTAVDNRLRRLSVMGRRIGFGLRFELDAGIDVVVIDVAVTDRRLSTSLTRRVTAEAASY